MAIRTFVCNCDKFRYFVVPLVLLSLPLIFTPSLVVYLASIGIGSSGGVKEQGMLTLAGLDDRYKTLQHRIADTGTALTLKLTHA